ncbi:uroporphyrinogen-III C-methyltransferase [Candidatus Spongiihabitans sp.]|uniref:uroporphyrinogen-III C-methyltransferase n=1 Tax=Candidatus Spongiihabitans sp. TaxID=3101308 RepID=UPI003C7EA1C3
MAASKTTTGRQGRSVAKKKTGRSKVGAKKTPSTEANDSGTSPSIDTPANKPAQKVKSAGKVVAWAALLVSVLALGAGGYAWYLTAVDSRLDVGQQQERFNARFNTRFNTIEQRMSGFDAVQSDANLQVGQLQNQIALAEDNFSDQIRTIRGEIAAQESAVREQVSTSERVINAQADNFRQEFNALSDSMVKLRAELGRGIDSWMLEEAEQLIFIANQQLQFAGQFSGDSGLAKRALQYADERLRMLANPALNQVRRLLATEITALDNVQVVDAVGVLNKLSSLSGTVENLALAGDIVIPEKTGPGKTGGAVSGSRSEPSTIEDAETANSGAEVSGMKRYMQPIIDAGASFLASLGDLIQVEKNGKSIKPVISAELRQMTYAKTKLILESAQIAFIRQQPELYQNRIQSAAIWVAENFAQNSEQTAHWLAQLDEVGAISPQAKIPDISGSLKAIRAVIKSAN